jgi:class 3 adenylate cyclase
MDSLEEWLASLGLEELARRFAAHDIDLAVLPHLTDADLEKIGVSLGHRRKILHGIAGRQSNLQAPPSEQPATQHSDGLVQQQLTILQCRLADTGALADRLGPEDLGALLRNVQLTCGSVVRAYNGFLARLLSDGLIAFFGYPNAEEDDAERAVRAALEICAAVEMLETTAANHLSVQIGIASGSVALAAAAGEARVSDQALRGEVAQLSGHLQTLAAPGRIVISSATRELIGAAFELRALGYYEVESLAP